MSRVAKNKIVIFGVFMLLVLQQSLFLDDCKNLEAEKGLVLILQIVEKEIKITQSITVELKFISRKGTFRIYKHPKLGVAAAVGRLLEFTILFPDGTALRRWCHEYEVYVGGVKLPWKDEYVDVKPGSPYTERIVLHPADDYVGYWPDDGIVRIKASYSYKHKKIQKYGADLWEGEVESNWAEVEITYY